MYSAFGIVEHIFGIVVYILDVAGSVFNVAEDKNTLTSDCKLMSYEYKEVRTLFISYDG